MNKNMFKKIFALIGLAGIFGSSEDVCAAISRINPPILPNNTTAFEDAISYKTNEKDSEYSYLISNAGIVGISPIEHTVVAMYAVPDFPPIHQVKYAPPEIRPMPDYPIMVKYATPEFHPIKNNIPEKIERNILPQRNMPESIIKNQIKFDSKEPLIEQNITKKTNSLSGIFIKLD